MNQKSGVRNRSPRTVLGRGQGQSLGYIAFLLSCFLAFLILIAAPAAQAQSPLQPDLQQDIFRFGRQAAATGFGLMEDSLADLDARIYAARIARGALGFIGLVLTIFIIYSGVLYMTAMGNAEKTSKAKKLLAQAVIGAAIIFSSYGITFFTIRRMVRVSFENIIAQANACGAGVSAASCCREWNSFQNAQTNIPGFCAGASSWSECGDDFAQAYGQGTQHVDQEYQQWQECWERETERAGVQSDVFEREDWDWLPGI